MTKFTRRRMQLLWILLLGWPWWANAASLSITRPQAACIGEQIWRNEGGGNPANLLYWSKNEPFPSLGIGHFIWYPAGVKGPFEQQFPALLKYLQRSKIQLPHGWKANMAAPWPDREQFYREMTQPRMQQLRALLQRTFAEQTQFMIARLNHDWPQILAAVPESERSRLAKQFTRVSQTPNGYYLLIDYLNFKGAGLSLQERYQGEGWGLLQVLEAMPEKGVDAKKEFAQAAIARLRLRVSNAPRDERHWMSGWIRRIESYTRAPKC